jgi:hydroxymethylglutaryl-CoA lyase
MAGSTVKLIECPRDAMQGWKTIIPTQKKIEYIESLLLAGFDTIDFGSFVSPKAIPQMADTALVATALENSASAEGTRLLAIVANQRGAEEAVTFRNIHYLGYPFSISETFQLKNTNAGINASVERVEEIQNLCVKNRKELVVYISMGFGNPYGDPYDDEIVFEWVSKLVGMDISIISLADTVGLATPLQVHDITRYLIESLPGIEIGVHLHSSEKNWKEKLDAALAAGCRRFDGALKGIGGCPMADDELVGNMNTEWMISYFEEKGINTGIDQEKLAECLDIAGEIFS